MKIIFLDIDGVMNSMNEQKDIYDSLEKEFGDIKNVPEKRKYELSNPSPFHMTQLNRIIKETGALVVLSSTWRQDADVMLFNRYFALLGFDGKIIAKTPKIDYYRGKEIDAWIKSHEELESFVILDDNSDMEPYMNKLVFCDSRYGLTEKEADKAILILQGTK